MTPKDVMKAYKAINELANCVFPYKVTRQVHMLKKRLEEEFEIVLSSEKNLVAEHGGKVDSTGMYKFANSETAHKFDKAYQDMLNQESDIDLPRVDLSKYQNAIVASAATIDALDGLVLFEEE